MPKVLFTAMIFTLMALVACSQPVERLYVLTCTLQKYPQR